MTATGKFTFGSITPEIEARCEKLLQKLREAGHGNIQMFKVAVDAYTSSTTSFVMIAVGETDVFDGTSTAAVVDIKSSSNDDSGVTITIVGLDDAGALTEEDITFTDTEGTIDTMTSTTEWTRIIGVYTAETLAGNVTLHENEGTAYTYATLAAATKHTINTRFWVPTGYEACLGLLDAQCEGVDVAGLVDSTLGVIGDDITCKMLSIPSFGGGNSIQGSDSAETSIYIGEKYGNQAGDFGMEVVYFYWAA